MRENTQKTHAHILFERTRAFITTFRNYKRNKPQKLILCGYTYLSYISYHIQFAQMHKAKSWQNCGKDKTHVACSVTESETLESPLLRLLHGCTRQNYGKTVAKHWHRQGA